MKLKTVQNFNSQETDDCIPHSVSILRKKPILRRFFPVYKHSCGRNHANFDSNHAISKKNHANSQRNHAN